MDMRDAKTGAIANDGTPQNIAGGLYGFMKNIIRI